MQASKTTLDSHRWATGWFILAFLIVANTAALAQPEMTLADTAPPKSTQEAQELPRAAWAEYSRAGREHIRLQELRDAEEAFLIALSVAGAYPPERQRLATSLSNLETLSKRYQAIDDQQALVRIGPHLVDASARLHGGSHPTVSTHLTALARAHANTGDPEMAQVVFLEARNAINTREGADSYELVEIHTQLGSLALQQGDLVAADNRLKSATAIIEQHRGPDDPDLVPILSLQARLENEHGRDEGAERVYLRTLDIVGNDPGSAAQRAQHLHQLAGFYLNRDRASEAEPLLQQALVITADVPIPSDQHVALLDSLGRSLQSMGRYGEANIRFQEAVALDPQGTNPEFDDVRAHHAELQKVRRAIAAATPRPRPEPQAAPESAVDLPTELTPEASVESDAQPNLEPEPETQSENQLETQSETEPGLDSPPSPTPEAESTGPTS